MPDFLKRIPPPTIAIGVAVLIFIAWTWLWSDTFQAYVAESRIGMSARGQFGDAFGSLNTLFTGLGSPDWFTLRFCSKISSRNNERRLRHKSTPRRRTEKRWFSSPAQFLSARLNAAVALVQAHESYVSQLPPGLRSTVVDLARRDAKKLRQRIAILVSEANLGFEGGEWRPAIERRAIREHLIEFFRNFRANVHTSATSDFQKFVQFVDDTANELQILVERTDDPENRNSPNNIISGHVASILESLGRQGINSQSLAGKKSADLEPTKESLVKWIDGVLRTALIPTSFEHLPDPTSTPARG